MPKQCTHQDCQYNVFSKGLCNFHWRVEYAKTIKVKVPVKPVKYATKAIKQVSTRQQKLNSAYTILNTQFKKDNPICKARVKCIGALTTDTHHRKGRGSYLLDSSTWLPVCRLCHDFIEQNPTQAKALGLSENRLDKY